MKILKLIVIFFFIVSCKSKNEKLDFRNNYSLEEEIIFRFPDTINISDDFYGEIEYKVNGNPLKEKRPFIKYTFLYAALTDENIESLEEIFTIQHDTFVPIDNRLIPVFDLEPQSDGKLYFQGFLVNQFFYEVDKDSTRIITTNKKVTHSIFVENR